MQLLASLPLRILGPGALATLLAATVVTTAVTTAVSTAQPVSGTRAVTTVRAPGPVASNTPLSSNGIPDPAAPPTTGGSWLDQRHPFGWPLSPQPAVHRRFEKPLHQWARGHRGADLLAAVGQPVLSAGDGVVAFSGMVAGRGVITVRHTGGLRTTYEPVEERLASRTRVRRGTRIGVVSTVSGHCVPLTCLHWGAISGQAYQDPLSLVSVGRPILLPLS
jgi:murein DD-endopeptidase MepM/ murein hydrolase activator NlpD